jgi:hypothetical protein
MKEIVMQDNNNNSNKQQDIQKKELDAKSNEARSSEPVKVGDAVKSLYERLGGEYVMVDGYRIPALINEEEVVADRIGRWGRKHGAYLKQQRPAYWLELKTSGRLGAVLAQTEADAKEYLEFLMRDMAAAEGVTEALKATDQMAWVRRMNNIRNRAEEIVLAERVYI